jgi:hypothetical protein
MESVSSRSGIDRPNGGVVAAFMAAPGCAPVEAAEDGGRPHVCFIFPLPAVCTYLYQLGDSFL